MEMPIRLRLKTGRALQWVRGLRIMLFRVIAHTMPRICPLFQTVIIQFRLKRTRAATVPLLIPRMVNMALMVQSL